MAARRRRTTGGGLIKTSVQLSPYQVEMLGRLSMVQEVSVSAIIGQAVDDKLRASATQRVLARYTEPETEPESEPEAAAV